MSNKIINIIIVETSHIIFEGISAILTKSSGTFNIHQTDNIAELQQINLRIKAEVILVNPVLIQNQLKDFYALKKELNSTLWIATVYTFLDQQILSSFDKIIYINDLPNKIIALVQNHLNARQEPGNETTHQETLSDREIAVLTLLVKGSANKEIADKLNISTHTVISHRKNISQKTGIRSVAGLTIYAVVNHIIAIHNYRS